MKPMLASDAKEIKFPCYASPKLDGVRCVVKDGQLLSRTLKPIPNRHTQQKLAQHDILEGLDGELIVGSATSKDVYRTTSSGVMSSSGEPEVVLYVFDYFTQPDTPYEARWNNLVSFFQNKNFDGVRLLPQAWIINQESLDEYEACCIREGYEGIMVRSPEGRYKFGRSTAKEGLLLKVKRFADSEAIITGFEELMRNHNEAERDELGHTKRSSHQENLVGGNTLGALCVQDCESGIAFKIGTGYTAQVRQELWDKRDQLDGKIVKYKHFEIGVKDAPRFPVFLGFRNPIDMEIK